jgi:hypothetical protein
MIIGQILRRLKNVLDRMVEEIEKLIFNNFFFLPRNILSYMGQRGSTWVKPDCHLMKI